MSIKYGKEFCKEDISSSLNLTILCCYVVVAIVFFFFFNEWIEINVLSVYRQ